MTKTYRISWIAFLMHWVVLIALTGIAYFIAEMFIKPIYAAAICGGVSLLFHIMLIRNAQLRITISRQQLNITVKGHTWNYDLQRISCSSESINNTSFTLYITDEHGAKQDFDLSLLGSTKYHELLHDLGVIGEQSPVVSLQARKKK